MTPREAGFLLLSSRLGNPDRKPLTTAQLRILTQRMSAMEKPGWDRDLDSDDLVKLGYSREMAGRILSLLEDRELLMYYCARGKKADCVPLTRVSPGYPPLLRQRLGSESPGCLWAKGDVSLLEKPAVALVGSRELGNKNRAFAREVGYMAAENGWVLVSGNARGADRAAQTASLEAGGQVVSIIADRLSEQPLLPNVLYLSEDGFEDAFSAQRALSRNRCIHALGQITFVAQASVKKGGTWDGTVKNLNHGWSTVVCFRDGSEASRELEQMGAYLLNREELKDVSFLLQTQQNLFE